MAKKKEPMVNNSIRLPQSMWREIEVLQSRLMFKDKSECMRRAMALGLAQLKEGRA